MSTFTKSPAMEPAVPARDHIDPADWVTASALHERYMADVFRYVVQRVASVDEAEDITAEVFTAALSGLARFRGECPPNLWLLSIARRKIIDARRRRSARREMLASELAPEGAEARLLWEAVAAAEGPEQALLRAEARRTLNALVAELTPDQREALMLHYMDQLSAPEIAVVMGRSPASIYKLLERARAALYRRGHGYFLEGQGRDKG